MIISRQVFLSVFLISIFFLQVSRTDSLQSFEQIPIIIFIIIIPILLFKLILSMQKMSLQKILKISFLSLIIALMILNFNDDPSLDKIFGVVISQIPLLICIFAYIIFFETLVYKYKTDSIFILLFKIVYFYAVSISLFGLILWFTDISIFNFSQNHGTFPYDRMVGPTGSVKTFGFVSAVGFVLSLFVNNFFNNKFFGKIIQIFSLLIFTLAVFFCGHKGSMLGIIAVLFLLVLLDIDSLIRFFFIKYSFKNRIILVTLIVLPISIFLLLIFFYDTNFYVKWYSVIFGGGEFNFNNERFIMWDNYINHFYSASLTNKFFGHGHYALVDIYSRTSHNSLLTILLDHGLIVLILFILLFCILVIFFINGAIKNDLIDKVSLSLIVFFLVSGLTNDTFLNVSSETYILCLIVSIWLNREYAIPKK